MKKYLRYMPLCIGIIAIFVMTLQSVEGTMFLSNSVRAIVVRIVDGLGGNTADTWWNDSVNFRKFGHIAEFLVLGILISTVINKTKRSIAVCACISLIDQTMKIFVPVRHFDPVDLLYDAIGYLGGILLVVLILKCFEKRMNQSDVYKGK